MRSLCETQAKCRQASCALRSVKTKNQSAFANSVQQHDKTITIVSSVSIQSEKSVCVREMSDVRVCTLENGFLFS